VTGSAVNLMLGFVAAAATLRWQGRAAVVDAGCLSHHIMIMIVDMATITAERSYSSDCGTHFHTFYTINACRLHYYCLFYFLDRKLFADIQITLLRCWRSCIHKVTRYSHSLINAAIKARSATAVARVGELLCR